MNTLIAFGQHIKELRLQAGLSQQELAAVIKCHHTYLSHIENGRKPVSMEMVWDLANALDTDYNALLDMSATMEFHLLMDAARKNIKIARLLRKISREEIASQQIDAIMTLLGEADNE